MTCLGSGKGMAQSKWPLQVLLAMIEYFGRQIRIECCRKVDRGDSIGRELGL